MRSMIAAITLFATISSSALAQDADNGYTERGPRFLAALSPAPVRVDAARMPALRRRISVDLHGVSLPEALRVVSDKSGVHLAFSNTVLPERVVDFRADNITVAAALTELLLDARVDILFSRDGRGVLVRRQPGAVGIGTVVGRVTDAKTGQGIAGAEAMLDRTRWRTTSDTAGWYRLVDVDAGTYTLTIRRLGYAKQSRTVVVHDGQTDTVNVALEPVATRLDELVTTATGERRRRQVPNDITLLNADSIMRTQPVKSVTEMLEGRVPGLLVQRTSGAPGDPSRLRLRGASSPNLNNDPIVVVDGVRVYAEQSAARSANLAGSAAGRDIAIYAAPSPLDYIDPNSIETIEIVKGPSAATLYGQDAANGVIVITTKKGKAGPTRWTLSAEHGVTQMVASYPERVLRWGHLLYTTNTVACPLGNLVSMTVLAPCVPDSIVRFQLLNEPDLTPFGRGPRTAATLGVSGGVRALTYNVTGSWSHDLGLLRLPDVEIARYQNRLGQTPPDWMRRPQAFTQWGVMSQLNAQLGATADLSFRASLSQSDQRRSALEQLLGDLDATYFDRASGLYYEPSQLAAVTAFKTAEDRSYVFDDYYTKVTAAATALTTGAQLNWRPLSWLTAQIDAGVNVIQRADALFLPRSQATGGDSVGLLSDGQGRSLVHTLDLRATAIRSLPGGFTMRLSSGANYTSTATRDIGITTTNLPAGQEVPGTSVSPPSRGETDLATFGWYVEPALDHGNFTLISGLRLDGGSSYGGGLKLPAFPRLGGTWTISDEPFFPFKNVFSSFRLRAAYGRAGRQPGPADRLRLYKTTELVPVDSQYVPATWLTTLGNAKLRPERTVELEGGFDADLWDSRLRVELTGYRKTTNDAIVSAPLPPSLSSSEFQANTLRNIGITRNTGLDVSFGVQWVRSAPVTWTTDLILSHRRDEVVRLGPGVEPFTIQGGLSGGGIQRVVPGYPLFSYWTWPVVGYADLNENGFIDPGEVVLGDTLVYRGSPLPDYTATLSSSVGLWHGAVQVTADLLYDKGMSQHPTQEIIGRQVGLSAGRNDPSSSRAEQALVASFGRTDYYWYQQVTTTRLNAVTLSYNISQTMARRVGAERLTISLQGSNLGLWSNYRGVDPNVNGYATGNLMVDNGQLPRPRTWQVRVNATY